MARQLASRRDALLRVVTGHGVDRVWGLVGQRVSHMADDAEEVASAWGGLSTVTAFPVRASPTDDVEVVFAVYRYLQATAEQILVTDQQNPNTVTHVQIVLWVSLLLKRSTSTRTTT